MRLEMSLQCFRRQMQCLRQEGHNQTTLSVCLRVLLRGCVCVCVRARACCFPGSSCVCAVVAQASDYGATDGWHLGFEALQINLGIPLN